MNAKCVCSMPTQTQIYTHICTSTHTHTHTHTNTHTHTYTYHIVIDIVLLLFVCHVILTCFMNYTSLCMQYTIKQKIDVPIQHNCLSYVHYW